MSLMMTVLGIVAKVVGFALGLAFVPLIAASIGRMLPSFLTEPIANLTLTITQLGVGPSTFNQTETGEYELVPVDQDELGHRSFWQRWVMVPFGVTFDATKDAFESLAADVDLDSFVAENQFPFPAATTDMRRGGKEWYADLREEGDIVIPFGEALSKVSGTSSMDMGVEAIAEAQKEHGGDTSSYSPKIMLMGMVIFAAMGMGMGFVIFL